MFTQSKSCPIGSTGRYFQRPTCLGSSLMQRVYNTLRILLPAAAGKRDKRAQPARARMRMSTCTRCLWLQILVVTVQLLMLARQAALWQSDLPRAMWNNHSSAPRPAGLSDAMPPPPPPSPPPEAGAAAGHAEPHHTGLAAGAPEAGEPGKAPPLVLFAAGVQGSGHEALSELLIRLPQAWPMALTEEQSFLSLWWGDEPEAALPSVREAFADWVGQARGAAKRLAAFGSRACLVEAPHTDCSWVAGAQLQRTPGERRPPLKPGWELRPTGEAFSFPFANTAEPGRQKAHHPSLRHLPALAAALTPPSPLLVLVLWRPPLDCLKRQLALQPPRFWRAEGLDERLKLAASSALRAGAALHAQLLQLPSSTRLAIVQTDRLFHGVSAGGVSAEYPNPKPQP